MEQNTCKHQIKTLLKRHPRGLTISDIASQIRINRNAAATYLKVLEAEGEVEYFIVGTGKIYVLAHKLPISALFSMVRDLLCVVDDSHTLIYANKAFFDFFGLDEKMSLLRNLNDIEFDETIIPTPSEIIIPLFAGKESTNNISINKNGRFYRFRTNFIPVQLKDGFKGIVILFDDITKEFKHLQNLEFLAQTSAAFADMGDDVDIYQYIASKVAELEPHAHINICSIDPHTQISKIRATSAADPQYLKDFNEHIAQIGNIFNVPLDMNTIPHALEVLSKGKVIEAPRSFYDLTFRSLPESWCNEIQKNLSLDKNYTIGCACRGGVFGNVTLILRKGDEIENQPTLEAFVRQAGVALQRRYIKEKLKRMELKFGTLDEAQQILENGPSNNDPIKI
ncbi:MAG TPA: PAS domain-containing protein [Methanoregulaceae archaeon]|nr:PAS domain-containing protein [Methanoregulaceae archaeon]